ncbi:MAG: DUF433 domain-containing protein [Saprospiraceae bacterium]
MRNIKDLITIDPEILGGQPVFKGTRVPIESLFDHLEEGVSLDEFLEDFDTVSKEQAIAVMEIASKLLSSKKIGELYASVAG